MQRDTSNTALSDVEETHRRWGTSSSRGSGSPLQRRGESAPVMQSPLPPPEERFTLPEVRSLSCVEGISAASAYQAGPVAHPQQQQVQLQQTPSWSLAASAAAALQRLHLSRHHAAHVAASQQQASAPPPAAAAPAGSASWVPLDPAAAPAAPAADAALPDSFGGTAAAGIAAAAAAQAAHEDPNPFAFDAVLAPATLLNPFAGMAAAAATASPPPPAADDPFGGAAAAAAAAAALDPGRAAPAAQVPPDPFAFAAAPAPQAPLPNPFGEAAATAPPQDPFGGAAAAAAAGPNPIGGAAAAAPPLDPLGGAAAATAVVAAPLDPFGGAAAAAPPPDPFGAAAAAAPPHPFGGAAAAAVVAAPLDPFGGAAAAAAAPPPDPFGGAAAAAAAAPPDPFGGAAAVGAPALDPFGGAAAAPPPAAQAAFNPFGAAAGAAAPPNPFAQVAAALPPLPAPLAALAPPPEADFIDDYAAWGPALQHAAAAAGGGGAGGGGGGGGGGIAAGAPAGAGPGPGGAGGGPAAAPTVVLPAHINTCDIGDDGDCIVHMGAELARGSFGTVYPGLYYDDPVAVKMLRVAGFGVDEATLQQRILREVQLQARAVSHNGVVKFVAVCFSPPAIVMEMCACSLSERIINYWATQQAAQPAPQQQQQPQQQPELLSWRLVVQLLRQAAAALAFLHRPGQTILHNDLRAANMVLTHSPVPGGCPWKLKICDFGLAVAVQAAGAAQVPEVTHTSWRAPELDASYNLAAGMYTVTPAADVFALGCVLREMLVPTLPQAQFPAADARLPALADAPPAELEPLFQACVHQDVLQRPTAQFVWHRLQQMQVA